MYQIMDFMGREYAQASETEKEARNKMWLMFEGDEIRGKGLKVVDTDENKDDNIALTLKQREAIYREVKSEYIANDILEQAEDTGVYISDESAYLLAKKWVYDGKYDCNSSYWDNIDNLIRNREQFGVV